MQIFHNATVVRTAKALMVATMMLAPLYASAQAEPRTRIQAGVLDCHGEGGWGAIIVSKKEFYCTFSNSNGQRIGRYKAVVRKYGLDIGVTGKTALQWAVVGPATKVGRHYVPGSLQGEYAGVGAEVAAGAGLGANALVGGGTDSLALQPISVQSAAGANIAAGVQTLVLTYLGPAG